MVKKVAVNPQERLVHFLADLLNATRPIDFFRYQDAEEWGDERTFRRMRAMVNQVWEMRNQTPLFEIVDADGRPKQRGDGRFVKLVDKSLQTGRLERMAVMPAFMQMLQTLKGTILAEEFNPLYKSWYSDLKGSAKRHFDRTERKFFCFSKGAKRYDAPERSEVLEEVYDALLKEQYLEVVYTSKNAKRTETMMPLSLVMFNTGLYLLCRFKKQEEPEKVYSFALETFHSAKSLRGKHFTYPSDFDPQSHFDGDFGFIRSQNDKHEVVLEYRVDSWVRQYLRDRRWTGSEHYESKDGVTEIFSMTVSDLREVVSWVLPLCDQVKIVSPTILRQQVEEKIRDIAIANGF